VRCEERPNAFFHDLTTQALEPALNSHNRLGARHKDQIAGPAPDHFSQQLTDTLTHVDNAETRVIEIAD